MKQRNRKERARERGHSVLETALMLPWIFFLFVGAFDMGMYACAFISVENAARVGANYTSASSGTAADNTVACGAVLEELKALPNARNLASCASLPLIVSVTAVNGPDGAPASRVSVTYQTVQLIPLPGLAGSLTLVRTAEMRVRD